MESRSGGRERGEVDGAWLSSASSWPRGEAGRARGANASGHRPGWSVGHGSPARLEKPLRRGPHASEGRGEIVSFGSRWRGYWQSSRAPAPDRLGDLLFPFPRPARGAFPAPPPRKKTCRIKTIDERRWPLTDRGRRAAVINGLDQAQTRESRRAPFSQPLEGRKGEVSEGLASAGAVDDREGATSAAGARLVALHVANFFLDSLWPWAAVASQPPNLPFLAPTAPYPIC